MASRDLKELTLPARDAFEAWLADCRKAGVDVLVYCTYRSGEEQDGLYAIGRTKPGKKVTNAKAGESFHQWRCAIDCVPCIGGKPQWDDLRTYFKMAELAKPYGIEWAGDWVKFREQAHFQYTQGLTIEDFKSGKELQNGHSE